MEPALRTSQIREEARPLSEQLAEANRQLQNAQNEIVRGKTMITVGEMAAGAAHEMNNPLAVISGRSQLLASQLTDPKFKQAAQTISEQSHTISEIITELMDFAKPVPPKIVECELPELVDRALHEAKLITDPADRIIEVTMTDMPPVMVDPEQVTAALTEVISNAIQATERASGQVDDPRGVRCVFRSGGADGGGQRLRNGRRDAQAGVRSVLQLQTRRPAARDGPGEGAAVDREQRRLDAAGEPPGQGNARIDPVAGGADGHARGRGGDSKSTVKWECQLSVVSRQ